MRLHMPCAMLLATSCLTGSLSSQALSSAPSTELRTATFTFGAGNSAGWFGLRGEKYFTNDRLSVSGGLGYTPGIDEHEAAGLTMALAARGYTPGRYHRGFVELSFSQVQIEGRHTSGGHAYWAGRYGPGLQLGYQLVTRGGLTVDVSAGAGYSLGGRANSGRMAPLIGLGLGYTFP